MLDGGGAAVDVELSSGDAELPVQGGGDCTTGSIPAIARARNRARGIRPCCSAKPHPAMSMAAASRRGRLTAGETTRTSRSEGGMLISIALYSRIVYDAFV